MRRIAREPSTSAATSAACKAEDLARRFDGINHEGGVAMTSDGIDRSADAMFRNYDEAKTWVEDADLQSTTLVLEDHYKGEHIATAQINGSADTYRVTITNHEGNDTTAESVADGIQVAEMMGGWTVAGRSLSAESR